MDDPKTPQMLQCGTLTDTRRGNLVSDRGAAQFGVQTAKQNFTFYKLSLHHHENISKLYLRFDILSPAAIVDTAFTAPQPKTGYEPALAQSGAQPTPQPVGRGSVEVATPTSTPRLHLRSHTNAISNRQASPYAQAYRSQQTCDAHQRTD